MLRARYHQGSIMPKAGTDQNKPPTRSVGRTAAVPCVSLQRQLWQCPARPPRAPLGDGGVSPAPREGGAGQSRGCAASHGPGIPGHPAPLKSSGPRKERRQSRGWKTLESPGGAGTSSARSGAGGDKDVTGSLENTHQD